MKRVGVVGLGRMGSPMAANLVLRGFDVWVWNRTSGKAEALVEELGVRSCATPRSLAERVDVVVTMLADDSASWAVHCADDGLFAAADPPQVIFEMGTLSPGHISDLAAAEGDSKVIDAPVSGSIDAAKAAELLVMVGASESEVGIHTDVLAAVSREVRFLGARGKGSTMKLAVNMLIHSLNQAIAESLALADAADIDPTVAYPIIERSAAAAPMVHYRRSQYLLGQGAPVSFALELATKDVALAVELADRLGVSMPQALENLEQLRRAERAGFGAHDMAAMAEYLKELA